MKQENYFLKELALFKLSVGTRQILESDCCSFNYFKNGKPNICGLMNHLICELSVYRDDLHEKFLRHYKGDAEKVREVESAIYQVYLQSFHLSDDAAVNVPFRVNSAHRIAFEKICEEKLQKYSMNFTNYVRTLLGEYAIKPYYQRELYFYYEFSKEIERAIRQQNVCRYMEKNEIVKFIPASVEPFFFAGSGNCVVGISLPDRKPIVLLWRNADKMRVTDEVGMIAEEEYIEISKAFKKFIEEGEERNVWE